MRFGDMAGSAVAIAERIRSTWRRWAAALLASAVAVSASAFLTGTAGVEAKATRKITVYLGADNAYLLDWEQRMIALFEQKNPDIDVEVITNAGSAYSDKLTALWAAGTPPDVWGEGGAVRNYERLGWLLDLKPFVERDKDELDIEDFFPAAWAAYRIGGKQLGMPFMSVGSWLFYNVNMMEAAGLKTPSVSWDDTSWTWDRMVEAARKMAKWGGNRMTQGGVSVVHWAILDIAYPWMFGGDWFPEEAYVTGRTTRTTFARPENVRAYQAAIDLLFKEKVAWDPNNPVGPPQAFYNGQAGMLLGEGPWGMLGQKDKRKFDWGMAPMPRATSQTKMASIVYTDPWMISSATKEKEAAWAFVKFMTSKEVMKSYTEIAVFPPARRSAVVDYVKRISNISGHMSPQDVLIAMEGSQRYGRESIDHVIDSWLDIQPLLVSGIAPMWAGQKPVQQTLQELDQTITAMLQKRR